MSQDDISTWLSFALQQMAAESYLDQLLAGRPLRDILLDGSNDTRKISPDADGNLPGKTRMTTALAERFLATYDIVDHHANDSTGFSATLMRYVEDGVTKYTLSFRSTEPRPAVEGGDVNRDGLFADGLLGLTAAADGEIAAQGFAFGQLMAMEQYYADLRQGKLTNGTIDPTLQAFFANPANKINVTGYSLGGHLATVFTELHDAQVAQAYIFNGSGRGRMSGFFSGTDGATLSAEEARMRTMLNRFSEVLFDPAVWRSNATPAQLERLDPFHAIEDAAIAAHDANPSWNPFASGSTENVYLDPRYQWAKLVARDEYDTIGTALLELSTGLKGIAVDQGATPKIHQLYGLGATGDANAVAISGLFYGPAQPILIEGQPLVAGEFGIPRFTESGSSHSITLIVDSLAVQELIHTIDSRYGPASAELLIRATSNQRPLDGVAPLDTDNVAEADSLERTVDAFRKLFHDPALGPLPPLRSDSKVGGFANFQNRNDLYTAMAEIQQTVQARQTAGAIFQLDDLTALSLLPSSDPASPESVAQTETAKGLAYRYALRELNPFALWATDDQVTTALYQAHNQAGELNLFNPADGAGTLTAQYLNDRALFLAEKLARNLADMNGPGGAIHYKDVASGYEIPASATEGRHFLFGSDANDPPFVGAGKEDHLYGGGGNDLLTSFGGNDYLEGNAGGDTLDGGDGNDQLFGGAGIDELFGGAGRDTLDGGFDNDTLFGGLGFDTYIIRSSDGADTIDDTDGIIQFDNTILFGGLKREGDPPNVFRSVDGAFTYSQQGADLVITGAGPLTIKNFSSGALGIRLVSEADYAPVTRAEFTKTVPNPSPPPLHTQVPFFDEFGNNSGELEDPMTDDRNNLVHALGGDDTVISGSGDDQLYGEAGRDVLGGGLGDDRLFGGTEDDTLIGDDSTAPNIGGNDLLDGGEGNDLLQGNAGNDILLGGAGIDNLNGDDPLAANLGSNDDWLDGGADNDELHGAAGSDVLIGGLGDDLLIGDTPTAIGGNPTDGGDDLLDGGEGADTLYGLFGNDRLVGGIGDDQLNGQDGSDVLLGGAGDDQLLGDLRIRLNTNAPIPYWEFDISEFRNAGGEDVLDGGIGNDTLVGGDGDDALDGGEGNDKLYGDYGGFPGGPLVTGHDLLIGGEGNDELDGGLGDDVLDGGDGHDQLDGGGGADFLEAGAGDDNLGGGEGNDLLDAGDGDDRLSGDGGDDELDGGNGNDVLAGGQGIDTLFGGAGNDELWPGDANSLLWIDADGNTLVGGAGNDTYWVRVTDTVIEEAGGGTDQIYTPDSYALSDEVEHVTLVGGAVNFQTTAVTVVGNTKDNVLEAPGNLLGESFPEFRGEYNRVTLDGRGGNDTLIQGQQYVFGRDYGQDTVIEDDISGELTPADAADTIVMTAGVTPDDVTWERVNEDLVLRINGTTDQLTIPSYYNIRFLTTGSFFERELNTYVAPSLIESVQFADGTVWGAYDTFGAVQIGEMNDNTYLFGRGFGHRTILDYDFGTQQGIDTVQLTPDVAPDDVIVSRVGQDFVLAIAGTEDRLTMQSTFSDSSFAIEQVVFADGTVWDESTLFNQIGDFIGTSGGDSLIGNARNNTVTGLAGDDWLEGGAGDDMIDGGAGNDLLIGGTGADVLLFGRGSGQDTADDQSFADAEINQIQMGADVLPSDLTVTATANEHLVISINGTTDQLTLKSFFTSPVNQTYRVTFADGTVWTAEQLVAQVAGVNLVGTPDRDFFVGSPVNDVLDGLGGDDVLEGRSGADTLIGRDGNDELFGDAGADMMLGGAGNDIYRVDNLSDVVIELEGEGYDTVESTVSWTLSDQVEELRLTGSNPITGVGNPLDNLLAGNSADNVLEGGLGNDTLSGGTIVPGFTLNGNDTLRGGLGHDTYLFWFGGGFDVIEDVSNAAEGNRVQFGPGLRASDLTFVRDGSVLDIVVSGGTLRLVNFDPNEVTGSLVVRTLAFSDGTTLDMATLFPPDANQAPTLANPLADQAVPEGVPLNIVVPANTFADADAGDTLSYSASQADGTALPTWLNFDPATRTFSGTPDDAQVGSLDLRVTATDTGDLSISDAFTLTVQNVNEAPTVTAPLADQTVQEDAAFSFTVPGATFVDMDAVHGDMLTYGATLANGSALPSWLSFDSATRTFSGIPLNDDVGTLNLRVTATDSGNLSVSTGFALTVQNVNDAPTVANPIADQSANTGAAFNFTIAANTFADVDVGDTLTYSATLANGTALSAWLTFNPTTRTFSGTPADSDAGVVSLKVTATDSGTLSAFDIFDVTLTVPNLTLTGTSGNDVLTGGAGTDQLFGLAGNDILNGLAGNDVLDGGIGSDSMAGGTGNDTYLVDNTGDVVTELTSEGTDTVQSAVTYMLGSNVEHLTLTGSAAISGTGNVLDNVLIGNSANNTLNGGAGNDRLDGGLGSDTMVGGTGDDTYVVNQPGDIVSESLNQGIDKVESSITVTLGSNVENLVLTGTANINGTGSSTANLLIGNSGNNVLSAGSGNDTADGGEGGDTLLGGSGNDALYGGDGVDTLDGGSGEDQLFGGAGADTMAGGSGADQFTGGIGNDTMTGGSGNDVYSFIRGDGQDTIIDADPFIGNQDRAVFGATVNPLDLVISRQVDDLRIAIHGSSDQMTVRNWYWGASNQIEAIQAGDGQTLLSTQVDQLIQAMAGFSQQTGLTWDQGIEQRPQEVQTILAASWQ